MKKIFSLISLVLISSNTFAGSGFTWLGGLAHALHVPGYVLSLSLVGILLTIFGLTYRAKLSKVSDVVIPDRGITLRNLAESYGSFIYNQCKNVMGEDGAKKYFPFISTVFLTIFDNAG